MGIDASGNSSVETIPTLVKFKLWQLILVILIIGFYILSVLGWLLASYMTLTGKLQLQGKMLENIQSLTILDHTIRIVQVLIISSAAISLAFKLRLADKLFLASALFSLFTLIGAFFGLQWSISFLGNPGGIIILFFSYFFVHDLNKKGCL